MEDYQGSEEAEVHYEKKKKSSPTPGWIYVCLCILCVA